MATYKRILAAGLAVGAGGFVGAASASAVTVTNGGNITISAPAARIVVNGATAVNCAPAGGTGTIPNANPLVGSVLGTLTLTFSSCVAPGGLAATVVCAPSRLLIRANPTADTTLIRLDPLDCTVRLTAVGCAARITGLVNGIYNNAGSLTMLTAGQGLTVSNSQCPSVLPNGTAAYGAPVSGSPTSVGNITYTLGAVKPQVNP